jgi:ABC-2 type transport system ATP-binding protein
VRRPEARISEWLERLGLADRATARVSSLSKGLAQRVQFLAAVVHNPSLLVLDEPFSGLDPVSLDSLSQVILELKRSGTTIILSTHDMTMAERLCDTVLMLHAGRKVLDGSVEQLKRDHGLESLRIRFADDVGTLDIPGVSRVRNYGREQVLELAPNADSQEVLAVLLTRGKLVSFALVRPTLHELFVDIAGGREAGVGKLDAIGAQRA